MALVSPFQHIQGSAPPQNPSSVEWISSPQAPKSELGVTQDNFLAFCPIIQLVPSSSLNSHICPPDHPHCRCPPLSYLSSLNCFLTGLLPVFFSNPSASKRICFKHKCVQGPSLIKTLLLAADKAFLHCLDFFPSLIMLNPGTLRFLLVELTADPMILRLYNASVPLLTLCSQPGTNSPTPLWSVPTQLSDPAQRNLSY